VKTYSNFLSEITTAQRIKRSQSSKRSAKRRAISRARSLKKPPTPEKVKAGLDRELRKKALSIVDKQGIYKDATAGTKASFEKKASKLLAKKKQTWTVKLKPIVKKRMRDAFRDRTSVKNPEL
tara:strand:- start:182 stop:550 length:369 start_codon:yes stop_codon:yes gene_type:complete